MKKIWRRQNKYYQQHAELGKLFFLLWLSLVINSTVITTKIWTMYIMTVNIWSIWKSFHEGTIWSGYRDVISFIRTKQIFLHFFRHGDRFYNQYINTVDRLNYIYDYGSEVKTKHFLQGRMRCTSFGDPLQAMWDIDRKTARICFGKKEIQLDLFFFLGQNSMKLKSFFNAVMFTRCCY